MSQHRQQAPRTSNHPLLILSGPQAGSHWAGAALLLWLLGRAVEGRVSLRDGCALKLKHRPQWAKGSERRLRWGGDLPGRGQNRRQRKVTLLFAKINFVGLYFTCYTTHFKCQLVISSEIYQVVQPSLQISCRTFSHIPHLFKNVYSYQNSKIHNNVKANYFLYRPSSISWWYESHFND